MRHLWLVLALGLYALGGWRLFLVLTQQQPALRLATPTPARSPAATKPVAMATQDPCALPSDLARPGRWWLDCWSIDEAGNWVVGRPRLYIDGVAHTYST